MVHDASAASCGRVLHLSEGCKAHNVGLFVEALKAHGGDPEAIERCSMDMVKGYIAGVREHLPQALPCLDPFHLVKLANEALDTVRRAMNPCKAVLTRTGSTPTFVVPLLLAQQKRALRLWASARTPARDMG